MELEGRYVALWLADAGARMLFGLEPSGFGQEYRWLIAGKVQGESPIGIWLKAEHVATPEGHVLVPPADVILVRWEWIITASLLRERPTRYEDVTLRLEAASG